MRELFVSLSLAIPTTIPQNRAPDISQLYLLLACLHACLHAILQVFVLSPILPLLVDYKPALLTCLHIMQAAKVFNLYPRKGVVAPGSDADVLIFDPEATTVISAKTSLSKTGWSVYEGRTIKGKVQCPTPPTVPRAADAQAACSRA